MADESREPSLEATVTATYHPPADGGLSDLAKMMQAMLEDRRAREAEIQEERRQREFENEECMRGMREQIEGLQRLISGAAAAPPRSSSDDGVRLNRLSDQDDIEAYLLTFE